MVRPPRGAWPGVGPGGPPEDVPLGLISEGRAGIPRGKGVILAEGQQIGRRGSWELGGEPVAGKSFMEAESHVGSNQRDSDSGLGSGAVCLEAGLTPHPQLPSGEWAVAPPAWRHPGRGEGGQDGGSGCGVGLIALKDNLI